jgi:hypothetical protein
MSLNTLIEHVEALLGLIPADVPAAASVVVQLPAGVHTALAEAVAAAKADAATVAEHVETLTAAVQAVEDSPVA